MGVFCDTCKQYTSPSGCCVTSKLSVCQDVVKFASFDEFDSWFDLKVLGSLGELTPAGVMSWRLARACDIVSCSNLLVFYFAIVHTQVIFFRSPETLLVKFCSSCISCRMTVD